MNSLWNIPISNGKTFCKRYDRPRGEPRNVRSYWPGREASRRYEPVTVLGRSAQCGGSACGSLVTRRPYGRDRYRDHGLRRQTRLCRTPSDEANAEGQAAVPESTYLACAINAASGNSFWHRRRATASRRSSVVNPLGSDDSIIFRAVSNNDDAANQRSSGVIERCRSATALRISAELSFM